MQNKLFLLLMAMFLSFSAFSQSYTAEWGPDYKKEGGIFGGYQLIGMEGNYYYVLTGGLKKTVLLKFDMNHKLVSNKPWNVRAGKYRMRIDKIINTKSGKFGYMSAFFGKKQWKIFVTPFKDGEFGQAEEVYSHEFKVQVNYLALAGFSGDSYTNRYNNKLIVSEDQSHVLFTNIVSTQEKISNEQMAIAVFDADMKLLWKKIQQLDYPDYNLEILKNVVSNTGDVYVLGKLKRKNAEKGMPNYVFKVFHITKDATKEVELELGRDIAATDVGIYLPRDDNKIVLAGFFTDKERKVELKGVFYATGTIDEGFNTIKTTPFEADFLEDLISNRKIKKGAGLKNRFDIENVLHFNDGSLGFIAEENYLERVRGRDQDGNITHGILYHANSLVIPRFSADGELLSLQKIPKKFSSNEPFITSYILALSNNKAYFLFNDRKTKAERKEIKGLSYWRYTDLVVIDGNGEITFNETIFSSKDIELEFIPHISDFDANKILISSAKGKKYSFGTIQLK